MYYVFSPKANLKLNKWAKSTGEFKGRFSNRLKDIFEFLINLPNITNYQVGNNIRQGSYYIASVKFYKNNNSIIVHDFEFYDYDFQLNSEKQPNAIPCIFEDSLLKHAKMISSNPEKFLFSIGELTVDQSTNPWVNFPSVNNFIIIFSYLNLKQNKILILNKIDSFKKNTMKNVITEIDNNNYKEIFKLYENTPEINSYFEFDKRLDIQLKQIHWLFPVVADLLLDDETKLKLLKLQNCSSLNELLEEFEEIPIDKSDKKNIEDKIIKYFEHLENKDRPIIIGTTKLDEPTGDIVETKYLGNIDESLNYWQKLINSRDDQRIIYSSPEQGVIRVFAGPATGKTQLMVIRALKFLKEAIENNKEKHILFITFNNDQSEDIKQRLLNLGCENYLLKNIGEKIYSPVNAIKQIDKNEKKRQTIEVYSLYEWCRDFVRLALKGSIADLKPFEKFKNTKEALDTRRKILHKIVLDNNKQKNKNYTDEENEILVNNCVSSIVRYIIPQNIIHKTKFVKIPIYRSKGYQSIIWHIFEKYRKSLDQEGIIDPEMFVIRSENIWRDITFKKLCKIVEYDNIFIDEVQDLLNHQRRLVGQLLKEESGALMYVGDPNQSVYHTSTAYKTSIFIRNPIGKHTKKYGLSVQLRYTRAIADYIQKFQHHNSRLEIIDDSPLYHQEEENIETLPDIGPNPSFIELQKYDKLNEKIINVIKVYLSYGSPDSKLTPDDILVIVLPEKNYTIFDSTETWEQFISNLKKGLRKIGIKSRVFDGSGNFSSADHINIVWGAENAKGKEKQVVIVLGADEGFKSAKVSVLEDSELDKSEQDLIEYKELKVAISRAQTYLHIHYCYKLHPFLGFNI